MNLHFASLEHKFKESEVRCAAHERTLAENAQTRKDVKSCWDVLIAQTEVIVAAKAIIAKNSAEAARQTAAVKKTKVNSDAEEERCLLNGIKNSLNVNCVFGEEMATFVGELSDLSARM